jgi:hypothetical protein
MAKGCTHIVGVCDVTPSALGCEECLKSGSEWLHLRICRTAVTSVAATILPTNMRPGISTTPDIRSSRVTIRRKVGAGVMSMKYYSICRTERPRMTGRSRATIEVGFEGNAGRNPSSGLVVPPPSRQGIGSLADGGNAGSGDPETGRISQSPGWHRWQRSRRPCKKLGHDARPFLIHRHMPVLPPARRADVAIPDPG